MEIVIRSVTKKLDIEEAVTVAYQAFGGSYNKSSISKFFTLAENADNPLKPHLLVAYVDNTIVATLLTHPLWYTNFYNSHLAVLPEYRGQGISSKLETFFQDFIFSDIFPNEPSACVTVLSKDKSLHEKLGYSFSDLKDESGNYLGIKHIFKPLA